MNRMLSALTASIMVLAMNGFAVAEDAASQPNKQQSAQPATQQQDTQAQPANQAGDSAKQDTQAQPADQDGDVAKQDTQAQPTDSAKEQEYSAALKKCEALSSSDKAKCTEAAKKKHGQM